MFHPKVMPFAGRPRRQTTIERKLPWYLLILSALGALGSIAGWIWTYIQPGAFPVSIDNGNASLLSWIPQLPLIGTLGVMALVVRLFTEGPMEHRRTSVLSRASRLFELGVWETPFVAGFVAAGLYYLTPVVSGEIQGMAADMGVGCMIARFCFSVLTISHLGHAAYIGWGLWNRRGQP